MLTVRLIWGQHPPLNFGHLNSLSVAALALILSAPSQCQTNRDSSLAAPVANSVPLTFSHAVHLIGPQHISGAILASTALFAPPVSAHQERQSQQKEASSADTAAQGQSKPADKARTGHKLKPNSQSGTSNDRLFDVLPNFLTLENAEQLPPLTTGEKFRAVARGAFDYVEYPWYGLQAGISQAENSEAGYGHGVAGYAKRYGACVADGTIENFMTGAVLPSLLRQDPRFYQSSNGRFLHRLGYAASRIFITHTDKGGEQFNYSEILGSAMSAGISTYSYHPHADRTLPNTAKVWGTQVGYDTLTIVLKEFWPDIRRKLSHKPQPGATKP